MKNKIRSIYELIFRKYIAAAAIHLGIVLAALTIAFLLTVHQMLSLRKFSKLLN